MNEPAHKKRKLNPATLSNNDGSAPEYQTRRARQLLAEEFDLEIALRKRLAATIESRVTWGLILQETLSDYTISNSTPGHFEEAALEAVEAIESPCNVLFDCNSTPPQIIHDLLERSSHASVASDSGPQPKSRIRKNRAPHTRPQPHNVKLLFIRNMSVSPPTVAKMVCPDCGKFDFTNLQGLLNHARLRHQREYGSHDQCVQCCAVIIDDRDGQAEWVVQNGIELGGISVPSVRRLFEIAVGNDRGIAGFKPGPEEDDQEGTSSTHLSKTLGHHKDTPALALFLGRVPKRRCINVYADDEDVNIDVARPNNKKSWHMSFPHRNQARPGLDVAVEASSVAEPKVGPNVRLPTVPKNTLGTRFHIIARVVVSDRSLWIAPERRPRTLQNHTHRWMVAVDSPSYSLHISAFLSKLTVTCTTDALSTPLTVTEPPFIISGTTDRPFLARVILTWVGSQNVPMEVEHWVELDLFHTSLVNPVLGEEQVLDVELDRHTELLPIRRNNDPVLRKLNRNEPPQGGEISKNVGQRGPDEPYYAIKLKALLPRYPLTMKDVKGRTSVYHIQYKLVAAPGELCNLLPGRRKAIEWGRARALRDAYHTSVTSTSPAERESAIPLSTGDVFRWLEDEGLFPRPVVDTSVRENAKKAQPVPTPAKPALCSVCGLNHQPFYSTSAMKTELSTSTNGTPATCSLIHDMTNWHRMPMVDIRRPLNLPSSSINYNSLNPHLISPGPITTQDSTHCTPAGSLSISQLLCSPHDLVAVANPEVIMAIREIVHSLRLSSFNRLSDNRVTKSEMEAEMAPFALLASLTQTFVHLLVRSGLDNANLDVSMATTKAKSQGRIVRKTKQPRDRLLTPSHIIRGLTSSSVQRDRAAMSLCLARLGLGVSTSESVTVATRHPLTYLAGVVPRADPPEV